MAATKFIYPKDQSKILSFKTNAYIISGNEKFLIEKIVLELKKKYSKNGLTIKNIYGDALNNSDGPDLISSGGDLFAEDYVYVIKQPEKINKTKVKTIAAVIRETLADSASVFIFVSEDLRKVSTYIKKLDNLAQITSYKMFTDQLKGWIKGNCKDKGFIISASAVNSLVSILGNNLKSINDELEKIFLYLDEEKNIEKIHIEELVVSNLEGIEFIARDITLAVLAQKKQEALKLFRKSVAFGTSGIMISAYIYNQFRRLLYARSIIERINKGRIERMLGKFLAIMNKDDFKANMEKKKIRDEFKRELENFEGYSFGQDIGISLLADPRGTIDSFAYSTLYDEKTLLELNSKLFELDFKMKSGQVDPETGVEEFILSV